MCRRVSHLARTCRLCRSTGRMTALARATSPSSSWRVSAYLRFPPACGGRARVDDARALPVHQVRHAIAPLRRRNIVPPTQEPSSTAVTQSRDPNSPPLARRRVRHKRDRHLAPRDEARQRGGCACGRRVGRPEESTDDARALARVLLIDRSGSNSHSPRPAPSPCRYTVGRGRPRDSWRHARRRPLK